jgi:hypothetical protein
MTSIYAILSSILLCLRFLSFPLEPFMIKPRVHRDKPRNEDCWYTALVKSVASENVKTNLGEYTPSQHTLLEKKKYSPLKNLDLSSTAFEPVIR